MAESCEAVVQREKLTDLMNVCFSLVTSMPEKTAALKCIPIEPANRSGQTE